MLKLESFPVETSPNTVFVALKFPPRLAVWCDRAVCPSKACCLSDNCLSCEKRSPFPPFRSRCAVDFLCHISTSTFIVGVVMDSSTVLDATLLILLALRTARTVRGELLRRLLPRRRWLFDKVPFKNRRQFHPAKGLRLMHRNDMGYLDLVIEATTCKVVQLLPIVTCVCPWMHAQFRRNPAPQPIQSAITTLPTYVRTLVNLSGMPDVEGKVDCLEGIGVGGGDDARTRQGMSQRNFLEYLSAKQVS